MGYTPEDGSVPKCVRLTVIAVYEDGSSSVNDIREPERVSMEILEIYSGEEFVPGAYIRDRIDTSKGEVEIKVKAKLSQTPMISIVSPPPE